MPKAPAAEKPAEVKQADPVAPAIDELHRKYGPGSIMIFGDQQLEPVEVISTTSLGLDLALGIGGLPRGRITEIYGPEASGKTTLAQHVVANAQAAGGRAAYIDVEHAVDPAYARRLGVVMAEPGQKIPNSLIFSQPDTAEQALETADMLAGTGAVDVIVLDSVAALVPKAELEGEMGDSHPGLQARLMSQALRKLTSTLGGTRTVCLFVNQLREKIGVFYGNPEVTSGGKALKFYATVRLDIRRIQAIKDGSLDTGNRVRVKVVKNKLFPPLRTTEFNIMFGQGIDRWGELIDLGTNYGLLKRNGSHYVIASDGQSLGNGRANAARTVAEAPEVAGWLASAITAHVLPTPAE